MQSLLLLRYFKWHYMDATREILKGWGNFLWFDFNYFSVGLLLRTLFSPWRRITWDYGRGFDPGRYLFTFASNLVSRILGAFVRIWLIAAGILGEILFLFLGSMFFLFWLALPGIIIGAFFYGFSLLF